MDRSITLIRPNLGDYRSFDALPPLSLSILAARTDPSIRVRFFDDRLEVIPGDDTPGLVALTVETFTARRGYEIADSYRARGVPVVLGGYHPTFVPDEAQKHADSIVTGDAEGTWERVVDDHFSGRGMKKRYDGDNTRLMDDVRMQRSIFHGKRYPNVGLTWFSRGCRFRCDFCSIHSFYTKGVRFRPVRDVVREMLDMDDTRITLFVDDNLFVSRPALDALLLGLSGLGLTWGCQISIDVARDETLLDKMRAAGCTFVLIGFESFAAENLRQMGKRWNKVAGDYSSVVRKLHDRGIGIYGTFVFGYDADTIESIEETYSFAVDSKLEIANFNPLTPTPGSPLYSRMLSEGRLLKPVWWLDPQYRYGDAIFRPKLMDPDAFAAKCFDVRRRFHTFGSIATRVIGSSAGLNWHRISLAAAANVMARSEILNKQYRHFGRQS